MQVLFGLFYNFAGRSTHKLINLFPQIETKIYLSIYYIFDNWLNNKRSDAQFAPNTVKVWQVDGRWIVTIKYVSWLWLSTFSLAPRLPTDHSQLKTSKLEVFGILVQLETQYMKMFPQRREERRTMENRMSSTL